MPTSGPDPDLDPDAAVDYYALLGVASDASTEEIITAYRAQAKQHHPDLAEGDREGARAMMQRLTEAKEVLTDPATRSRYDRLRSQTTSTRSREARQSQAGTQHDRERQRDQHTQRRQQRSRARSDPGWNDKRQTRTEERTATSTSGFGAASPFEGARSAARTAEWTRPPPWRRNPWAWPGWYARAYRWIAATLAGLISTLIVRYDAWLGQPWEHLAPFQSFFRLPSAYMIRTAPVRWVFSPTPVRVSGGIVLALAIHDILPVLQPAVGWTPEHLLALVLGGLAVSYGLYERFGPLPTEPRTSNRRPAFDPQAGATVPVYPMLVVHLVASVLVALAIVGGDPTGGLDVTASLLWELARGVLILGVTFAVLGAIIGSVLAHERGSIYGAIGGAKLAPVAVVVGTFVDVGPPPSVPETGWGEAGWVGAIVVGPLHVGLLVNFVIGLVVLGCVGLSTLYMLRFFTRVPGWDRYQNGYRVVPGVWNLLVLVPFVIGGWMLVTDVEALVVSVSLGMMMGEFTLTRWGVAGVVFCLPLVLGLTYSGRRWVEEQFCLRHRTRARS